jgi:Protein of unknown function (DUF1592)/Protein of unknown function (DUF1588)/Protein of unknown function (DUF1587)/Protein of unknown function (DUF1585)/Protein of unknown function (DUF1595)
MARIITTSFLVLLVTLSVRAGAPPQSDREIARRFTQVVQPFIKTYCFECHAGSTPEAALDLAAYKTADTVVADHARWAQVLEKLATDEMPPATAEQHPAPAVRKDVVAWIEAMRRNEARKHAGDPGVVLARRLSNAEYNYTIRDLTGEDIRPAREFPVDPANLAGFDNSGESLAMSPALLTKYLQAAREVANHLVLQPRGFTFAPHPMLVETDRDKFAVQRIVDLYARQATDYKDYFEAAWRYKHRAALGKPKATLAEIAAASRVSPKYLSTIWGVLEQTRDAVGPVARLQAMWRELSDPQAGADAVASGALEMRDFVVALRRKLVPTVTNISVKGISSTSQPFLMWRNRQYANNRRTFDRSALQVEGESTATPDPDLRVPAAERARYEAAFARFASVFPDAFYVSERGRYFPDNTRDKGRHLSAGFHNLMGYFRDDQPLYELVLDAAEQKALDALWQDLDFVASANIRTYVQFYFNESGEARGIGRESEGPRPADKVVTSEAMIKEVAGTYLARARSSGNAVAIIAIENHFREVDAGIRWVEKARIDSEPLHLRALVEFAARAYRRPLTEAERTGLLAYYRSLREEAGLAHDEAMRDAVVSVLMSPDFCYRIDLASAGSTPAALSSFALASRLSYFLWSSMPDAELMAQAATGNLAKPDVLAAQARRMLDDPRVRGLATEFGGQWLDFRRFEEHNAVDRERFSIFDNALRQAMFEEPVRFMIDVFRENRSVLDFLYGTHTFVNALLARHYGMPDTRMPPDVWVRVDDARKYERGGLLPMSVFLTKNAPGLRTSPVKRGYWVVKQVLGEHIPPPPAVVPELPRDEAKADLPLRDMLARHRSEKACASCHSRFDSFGLVFEGFGPVGERRTKDLAGRPVDASATFPGGAVHTGVEGLREYVRARRQRDFVDNLSRKLLAYALGRTLILSDDLLIESMRTAAARDGYRVETLVQAIVTSPQFRTKRGRGDGTSAAVGTPLLSTVAHTR